MESGKEELEVQIRNMLGIPCVWKAISNGEYILLSREESWEFWNRDINKNSIDLEDKSNEKHSTGELD